MTKVKIVNKSGQPVPAYATPLSAGMDLRAALEAPVTLGPLERTLVPTGLFIALPAGFEAQVRPPPAPSTRTTGARSRSSS